MEMVNIPFLSIRWIEQWWFVGYEENTLMGFFWSPVFLGSSVLMIMVFGLQYFWGRLSWWLWFLVSSISGVICLDDCGFWSPVFLGSSVLMIMVFGLQYSWDCLSWRLWFLVSSISGIVCLDDYGFWSPVFLGSSVLMIMVDWEGKFRGRIFVYIFREIDKYVSKFYSQKTAKQISLLHMHRRRFSYFL